MRLRLLKWYIHRYGVDFSEAAGTLDDYRSIADLFTRKLKPGARPIQGEVVVPIDGTLRDSGGIGDGTLTQIKGLTYTIDQLLGGGDSETQDNSRFVGGSFANFYLSPRDYHRIHSPVTGTVERVTFISGTLWPVNDWAVRSVPELFVQNARVAVHITTQRGPIALVMIGALNVGGIALSFEHELDRPVKKQVVNVVPRRPLVLAVGEEVGTFRMGSAVVCLFGPGFGSPTSFISNSVRVGQRLFG